MRIPPLASLGDPRARVWAPPEVAPADFELLFRQLAVIVGYNGTTGMVETLGTGTIVGASDAVYILTAAHVLHWFADKTLGPIRPTAFTGLGHEFDEQNRRMARIIDEGRIKAIVELADPVEFVELDLWNVSAGLDEREFDLALLQCLRGDAPLDLTRVRGFPIDTDPIDQTEPLVMVGTPSGNDVPFAEATPFRLAGDRDICVRAGRVAEITDRPEGARPGFTLWRANIPSLPGMSGGPLLRLRYPLGRQPVVFGAGIVQVLSAVGITSRGRAGGRWAPFENPDGETWVTPIGGAQLLQTRHERNVRSTVGELLKCGHLDTYRDVERALREGPARERDPGPNRALLSTVTVPIRPMEDGD